MLYFLSYRGAAGEEEEEGRGGERRELSQMCLGGRSAAGLAGHPVGGALCACASACHLANIVAGAARAAPSVFGWPRRARARRPRGRGHGGPGGAGAGEPAGGLGWRVEVLCVEGLSVERLCSVKAMEQESQQLGIPLVG